MKQAADPDHSTKRTTGPTTPLLELTGVSVEYERVGGAFRAVDRVSFDIYKGETMGLVGESGSGKSSLALSLLRLLPAAGFVSGSVRLEGTDLLALSAGELRRVRGGKVGMVFQEPTQALDPLMTISSQLCEAIRAQTRLTRREARRKGVELLEEVGIAHPVQCMNSFPHQLSGGMLQRVLIAMALSRSPMLLIGDEPTSALDTTTQARILALLRRLRDTRRLSMLLISHDLGVIAQLADRVAVMHAGQIVECADAVSLFGSASHPYTRALLAAIPGPGVAVGDPREGGHGDGLPLERRTARSGRDGWNDRSVPERGCRYFFDCPEASDDCAASDPPLYSIGEGRSVRCFRRRHRGGDAIDRVG